MMTSLYIIATVAILIAVWVIQGRRRTRFYETGGRTIFQDVYSGSCTQPTCEYRWSYGYPAFTIKFKTVNDKATAEAEGRNRQFSSAIEQLCKCSGSRKHPFDVAKSVCFISHEELDAFIERVKRITQQSTEDRQQSPAPPPRARGGYSKVRADVVHHMMRKKTTIGVGLGMLALILVVLAGFALREVQCGACGASCLRRSAVKVPEGAGGIIVETLFGRASASANAYVCQRCIEGLEARVIAEAKRRQMESAQP